MGILQRARSWIVDKLQRASTWFHKETHKERLEELQAKNFTNAKHREKRTELDPIIHALVQRVANSITARSPIFLDEAGNELEDLKEQWEKNYYNDLLNDVIQATRTHGFMVLEPNVSDLGEDRNWLVHDETDIMMTVFRKFKIEKYVVLPLVEGGQKVAVHEVVSQYDLFPKDVIHFFIGKFKLNRCGVAAIKPVWDNCVRYSEILGAMSRYDSRIGNGMMVVSVDKKTQKGEIKTLRANIAKTNTKNFLVIPNSIDNTPAQIKWEHSTGMIDWTNDLGELMKSICGATGFNVRWFKGDPKGAQSAAKEDKIANYQTLDSIFQEYVPFIRMLLLTQEGGEELNELVAEIKWDSEGVLDEDDAEGINDSNENEEKLEDELPETSKDQNT